MNFVAIDFKTANSDRASACSIKISVIDPPEFNVLWDADVLPMYIQTCNIKLTIKKSNLPNVGKSLCINV